MILQSNISVNILRHPTEWTENWSMETPWGIFNPQIGKRNLVNATKIINRENKNVECEKYSSENLKKNKKRATSGKISFL
jgi:hypothetical protein